MDFFNARGYHFPNETVAQGFIEKLMNAHNNTRLFVNNGFTPNELAETPRSAAPLNVFASQRDTFSQPPFGGFGVRDYEAMGANPFAKVGRNEFCPCGSGKKYKRCHGAGGDSTGAVPTSKLSETEADEFYRLWYGLLAYVNKKHNLSPRVQRDLERVNYKAIDSSQVKASRDKLWANPPLFEEYIESGANLTDDDRAVLRGWRDKSLRGRFIILRHTKDYAVFMRLDEGEESLLYGVVGIMNSIERLFPKERLPVTVDAALLPFAGRIVHDSFLASYGISYGAGAQSMLTGVYTEQLAKQWVATALE